MHVPVLLKEVIEGLAIKKDGIYVDCTVNRGGHSIEIAKLLNKKGTLICIDLDKNALEETKEKIQKEKILPRIHFICNNFRYLRDILYSLKIKKVDGILADLGVSSQELGKSKRGFSFLFDEPLKMTFSSSPKKDEVTAYDVVNFWSESTIADILYGFADEKYSRSIAKAIVESRKSIPISRTKQLVEIISLAVPSSYRHKKIHFATKTFLAIRMATNDELGSIGDLIESLPKILSPHSRACIITFHSTEDRLVKQSFKKHLDTLKPINKKVIIPQEKELKKNIKSRSAKLRIVERI